MTDVMKSKLKEWSLKHITDTVREKLIVKANEYVEIISAAKDEYIIQMCEKLNDPITAPKTYWKVINRF